MTRDEAWSLLNEFTKSESLIKHALAVEAAMRHYAARFGENLETWGLTGLIHDFDYERWPNPPDHTREGAKLLRERGVDEEIVGAILSHAEWNQIEYPLDQIGRASCRERADGRMLAEVIVENDPGIDMTPFSTERLGTH